MDGKQHFGILIVGGGIGGLTAAIALRAPGRKITILEQSLLASEIGATISLQPNASRIVQEEWGIDAVDEAQGLVDRGFRIFNTDGDMVRSIDFEGKASYEGDRVCYHRQDLHTCLKLNATSSERPGDPATLRTSSKVVACDCESGIVTLENGETLTADLVVGADGIHSKIRDFVLDEKVSPITTGFSAYRTMIPTTELEAHASNFAEKIKPRESFTSMIMAHDCRLISGPARQGQLYSFVGLVPDEQMNEDPGHGQSWRARGDLSKLLETYKDYPDWVKEVFPLAKDLGLWQLRDIDPLKNWTKGRVILIGDAAHAMLPTQGQGASQAVEDAEALGALFAGVKSSLSTSEVSKILEEVFQCRYGRASLIQKHSRLSAKPATEKGSNEVTMRPDEFMDYNCNYKGAIAWQKQNMLGTVES